MNLIVVRLIGGLGNQMFQYAMARALSLRSGAELKLDLTGFDTYVLRRYELDGFAVVTSVAVHSDLARFGLKAERRLAWVDRARRRLGVPVRSSGWPVYKEPHANFDPTAVQLKGPVYLAGYWQTQKYFLDCAQIIRQDFTPAVQLSGKNAAVAAEIDEVDAVSVHVRRGDYVTDPHTINRHGTCSLDYYDRAVDYVVSRVRSAKLFVFSDDQEWARDHLKFSVPARFVDISPPTAGIWDMQLMTRCRHHILANSSFSWWGAWLGASNTKIVVAPLRWFASDDHDTRDLLPDDWLRM